MDHQRTIRLTDGEYAALQAEAEETGEEIEDIIHRLLDQIQAKQFRLTYTPGRLFSKQELSVYLYSEGVITHIPTGEPDSEETKMERKRLGEIFGHGKPMSEMVIEDRGPY